jgi:4-hydroxyphenylpyruvate dioxygenase-like putative hemolysin
MGKLVCSKCMKVFDKPEHGKCPHYHAGSPHVYDFKNSDEFLKERIPQVLEERERSGLEGLVGPLQCVVINVEPERHQDAVSELLRYTGFELDQAFQDSALRTCVLKTPNSADFLVSSRSKGDNPFTPFNAFPRSKLLPNTRLETFVFETEDLEKYFAIQKSRGTGFLTDEIVREGDFLFIQTVPSDLTGNSIGLIQWNKERGNYATAHSKALNWSLEKPRGSHLQNTKWLDHTATRVEAEDRDAAIIEFMGLTNYNFDFAIYVKLFNSITNVTRLSGADFAMVFTSGISSYVDDRTSGPTEKFIHNYGPRVHHMAFHTEKIEQTFSALKDDGMDFLIGLLGSPDEGLKQTFSAPSEHTLLVNEYIHRYADFDGFFTKSNVTLLTEATDKQ